MSIQVRAYASLAILKKNRCISEMTSDSFGFAKNAKKLVDTRLPEIRQYMEKCCKN